MEYKLSNNYESMYNNIVNKLADYIDENPIQCLVIGVSGGIDSALCLVLADEAIKRSEKNIPLIGRSITIETNKVDEISRSQDMGKLFCQDFKTLDLTDLYKQNIAGLEMSNIVENQPDNIARGNIKARLRMIQLYHLAGINKGMVLSTDNFTELLMGFWTLHGDVGDYGMIQNLWKTEVYEMAILLASKFDANGESEKAQALINCIYANPTDGLGVSDSDLDQLGADSYREVDKVIIDYLNNGENEDHPVVQRYERTHFKRENPYNIPRKEIV